MTELLQDRVVLVAISFVVGLLLVRFVQTRDKHEHEPYGTLLVLTVFGGMAAILLSLALYDLVEPLLAPESLPVARAFIVIAPVEELAKLSGLFLFYGLVHKEIDEPVDGMIYMACVALGFSLVENYFYAIRAPDAGDLVFWRLFLSTPTHVTDSLLMGLGVYVWLQRRERYGLLIAAWFYAVVIHGLFDAAIFMDNDWSGMLLLGVMGVSLLVGIEAINFATVISPFRPTLKEFIASVKQPAMVAGITCRHCGDKREKRYYRHRLFSLKECMGCGRYLLNALELNRVLAYFAATVFEEVDGIREVRNEKNGGHYDPDRLHNAIEDARKEMIRSYTGRWLPFRHLVPRLRKK